MPGQLVENGERISLRTVEREDAEFLQLAHANPELRYPLGISMHRNRQQMEEVLEGHIENQNNANFLVCLDHDDAESGYPSADEVTPIGAADVVNVNATRPELQGWFLPEQHNQGYAKECLELLLDYVFRTFNPHGVYMETYDHNVPIQRLAEIFGFTEEGRKRESEFVDGEYRDEIQYGLLRREWEEES
ncbi:GNAT family N-acetyltransferase [Halorussus sp. MSC15.2]|uniref:GNAT family N-acetyltransferase n=1 Tax=Halorussus sp. MSC15.2 TaxID=2283638 RepID=UPI0013D77DD8|nr:GNAT family protein [Halorussus sp. MSC15.2]NEU58750.1 GNAT family N-acetyltransferase [Halorussus sp. MSC15.2]